MKMLKRRKGQVFENLKALGVGVAGLAIALVVTFLIIAQGQDQLVDIEGITNESNLSSLTAGYNATNTLTNAVATIPDWVPLIVNLRQANALNQ